MATDTTRSDAENMKAHLRGCAECSGGDYCDEGESYGGEVTHDYLTRITAANGCSPVAVAARIARERRHRAAVPPQDDSQ